MKYLVLAAVLATAPAWAQSKRYPAGPADEDRAAETHSKVWEQALIPERAPYDALVREARPLVQEHEPVQIENLNLAIGKLDQAIGKLSSAPEAYALRGEAYLKLGKLGKLQNQSEAWVRCADDLAAAVGLGRGPDPDRSMTRGERTTDGVDRTSLHLWLGLCAARAGRLALAEEVLATAASIATSHKGELYTRLGEVRIALGKLDEAIDALGAALEANDYIPAFDHWLLAAAYDRSRRNADALEHLQMALRIDGTMSALGNPSYPFLGAGEAEYLLGLTYPVASGAGAWQPQPEYGIVYFRYFLKLAPASPWRRRAEEHLRELTALDQPQFLARMKESTALVDLELVRASLHKAMPALRACMTKLPSTVFELRITKDGPRSPEARDRARVAMPPDGERAEYILNIDSAPTAELDAARTCLDQAARRVALTAPTEHDTYYMVRFFVISP